MIYIYWDFILIGNLIEKDGLYFFRINQDNLIKAKEIGCPVEIIDKPNNKEYYVSKELPSVFKNIMFSENREDLLTIFNITKEDSNIQILLKMAEKSDILDKNEFWISLN